MSNKLNKYYRTIPKIFKPETNPIINALIQGFAESDEEICTQLENTKAQLFVKTAENSDLDTLAASLGVTRPASLGLTDDEYRELIPNLSLKAKQIRKTFYDTMDVFWGPLFSRANVQTNNAATYNVSVGDIFSVKIDGGTQQDIKVMTDDLVTPGAMTAAELVTFLGKVDGATAELVEDPATSDEYVNLRTSTPGLKGSVEIVTSTMVGVAKVDFTVGTYEIWQQSQRSVIYEIRPNEMVIEIPAIVPALRRTLKGSHHLHTDSTLEGPVAPNNGVWEGSFFYDTGGAVSSFTVSRDNAQIQEILNAGSVYTKVTVDDASTWEATSGELIFGWGTDTEELPVRYRGIPNSNTVLLDPSYKFQNDHSVNTFINVLRSTQPYTPRENGDDLAIYLTSPSDAREIVQAILESLAAAGIIINFVILAPDYRYIIDNPYISTDDAPSA